ncbi:MAG: hypothetical protein WBO39_04190 [Ferruginibacter sp.]
MTIKTKKTKKAISKYVLMPGGSRLKSRVKKALEKAKAPQSTIKKLDKIAPVIATDRAGLLESDLHFIRSLVPLSHEIVNPRWVAYAGWNNQTGNPVGSMTAKLRVPEAPVNKFGPSVFIFPGLQSDKLILQPILQWGFTGMGGGAFWSIGSCLIGGQSSPVQLSGLTRVNPGDIIKAVIQLKDISNNKYYYASYFDGFDRSRIDTAGLQEMKYCCVTLESYNVRVPNDYPAQELTTLSGIRLADTNMRSMLPVWQVKPNSGSLGERAVVRRIPGEDDAIDLYF